MSGQEMTVMMAMPLMKTIQANFYSCFNAAPYIFKILFVSNGYYATKMISFYYGITGCQIGHSYFEKLAHQSNVQISDILNLLATLL